MTRKEKLIKTIERLPEDLIEEVDDFVAFVQKRRTSKSGKERSWGNFSLNSGSFDFWNDPEEVEYSSEDLKDKS